MSAGSLPTEVDDGRHVMILKFMDRGWAKALTDGEAPAQMPYFVGGEAYERMENHEGVTLTPYMMLCGILTEWFDPCKYAMSAGRKELRKFLLLILDQLREQFGIDTMEEMILNAAGRVRAEHGSLPAIRLLTAGCDILPDSSKIRSDLIIDTWFIIEHAPGVDRPNAMEGIARLFDEIDLAVVMEDLVAVLCYIYMVSLAFLGRRDQCVQFYWHTGAGKVRRAALKKRLTGLIAGREQALEHYFIWDEVKRREFKGSEYLK